MRGSRLDIVIMRKTPGSWNLATVVAIEIDREKCDGCGLCVDFCPVKVFAIVDSQPVVARPAACYDCETCVDLCPKQAIGIVQRNPS
ncbi:MAG: ferredoxin family protein [Thermodesulfobacteriota bacterium]